MLQWHQSHVLINEECANFWCGIGDSLLSIEQPLLIGSDFGLLSPELRFAFTARKEWRLAVMEDYAIVGLLDS
jgi:hypothetical protein